ncbi:variable large family protein (plasmid) [Borreliella garinii]|nr:variable large family protein [Borreliella garinii]WRM49130.1 variable large family protein [Borreliella garinii]
MLLVPTIKMQGNYLVVGGWWLVVEIKMLHGRPLLLLVRLVVIKYTTIVSAARNGSVDVGSVSDELNISGKDAQSAENPIEAAIGVNSVSSRSNQAFSKIKRNDEIATAIVLRGMAKGGRFFADDNAVSDVKQSAQLSILKTVTALADLVKGVVKECLDRIVKILEEEDHNKAHTAST